MQIAQELSGFSLGEADLLRRAMGKKIKKEMAQQRTRFVEGAVGNGRRSGARRVHLRAGGQIRGLRLQQVPRRGLCADRLSDGLSQGQSPHRVPGGVDDPRYRQYRQAQRLRAGSPPHGHSHRAALGQSLRGRLRPERRRHPLFARGAQECRPPGGRPYLRRTARRAAPSGDVSDFARAINPRLVNKRALETLAAAGALDELGIDRATAYANVDRIMAAGNRSLEDESDGQNDLFAGASRTPPPIELRAAKPWVPTDRLSREFEAIGFFLTGHPLDDYQEVLRSARRRNLGRLCGQGPHAPRRRHACRHRAVRPRAEGQERQSLRLRRLLRPDRAVRGGGVLRSSGGLARAASARQRGPARRRGRGRWRDRQGARPTHLLARGRRGGASRRHEDLSGGDPRARFPRRAGRRHGEGRASSGWCSASTTSRARSSSCCRKASTPRRSSEAR